MSAAAPEATNYRKSFSGGDTRPQVFLCSDNVERVLKLMGNPQGTRSLAADWVGSVLAALLDVPCCEAAIVAVPQAAIRTSPADVQAWAREGPAFGTSFLVQSSSLAGLSHLTECGNLGKLGRLLVLDTWIEVLDRKKPDGTLEHAN